MLQDILWYTDMHLCKSDIVIAHVWYIFKSGQHLYACLYVCSPTSLISFSYNILTYLKGLKLLNAITLFWGNFRKLFIRRNVFIIHKTFLYLKSRAQQHSCKWDFLYSHYFMYLTWKPIFIFWCLCFSCSSTLWVEYWVRVAWQRRSWSSTRAARSWCAARGPWGTRLRCVQPYTRAAFTTHIDLYVVGSLIDQSNFPTQSYCIILK